MSFYLFLCVLSSFFFGRVIYQWGSYEDRRVSANYYPDDHGKHEASEGFSPKDEDGQEG